MIDTLLNIVKLQNVYALLSDEERKELSETRIICDDDDCNFDSIIAILLEKAIKTRSMNVKHYDRS